MNDEAKDEAPKEAPSEVEKKVDAKIEAIEDAKKKLKDEQMRQRILYEQSVEFIEQASAGMWSSNNPQDIDEAIRNLARFVIVSHNQTQILLQRIMQTLAGKGAPGLYVPEKRIVLP